MNDTKLSNQALTQDQKKRKLARMVAQQMAIDAMQRRLSSLREANSLSKRDELPEKTPE